MFRSSRSQVAVALPFVIVATASVLLLGTRAGTATLAGQGQTPETIRLVPPDLQDTSWLVTLQDAQVKAARGVAAFHDFQFTDRLAESGISFRHRIVDDAGKTYKAAHYDHGNGIAIADVDGDGLTRHLLRQPGRRQPALEEPRRRQVSRTSRLPPAWRFRARSACRASFADIDNDGDADLYVTTVRGGNMLFENDGHGRFRDISAASGLGLRRSLLGRRCSSTTTMTASSICSSSTSARTRPNTIGGDGYKYYVAFEDAFSGHLKPERAEPSILYRNDGGNHFVDVSQQTGLVDVSWSGDASVRSTSTTTAGRICTC